MSERPIGDELDRRLRAVVSEIVEPAVAPESLDDLLVPRVTQGEPIMLEKNPRRMLSPAMAIAAGVVLVAAIVGVAVALLTGDDPLETIDEQPAEVIPDPDGTAGPPLDLRQPDGVPDALFAAEAWSVQPSGENLVALLDAIGGYEALGMGEFEGSFDLVTFDSANPDRLLASFRDPYNDSGENQGENVLISVAGGATTAEPYAAERPHDSANFERDGSIVVWEATRGSRPARREATVIGADGASTGHSRSVFNGSWAADGGSLFTVAPTSAATNSPYAQLILQPATGSNVTLEVEDSEWVNSPEPGVFAAYSDGSSGVRVFDSADGSELAGHVLAGRLLTRAVVSQDGRRAITTLADGTIEVLDTESGDVVNTLGQIDVGRVRDPLQLSADGSIALSVDESGVVRMWHVADGDLILEVQGFVAPHRSLNETNSTTRSSVIESHARRVAVFTFADEARWTVVDTDVRSWVDRACTLGGRSLTEDEREAVGLPLDTSPACG